MNRMKISVDFAQKNYGCHFNHFNEIKNERLFVYFVSYSVYLLIFFCNKIKF